MSVKCICLILWTLSNKFHYLGRHDRRILKIEACSDDTVSLTNVSFFSLSVPLNLFPPLISFTRMLFYSLTRAESSSLHTKNLVIHNCHYIFLIGCGKNVVHVVAVRRRLRCSLYSCCTMRFRRGPKQTQLIYSSSERTDIAFGFLQRNNDLMADMIGYATFYPLREVKKAGIGIVLLQTWRVLVTIWSKKPRLVKKLVTGFRCK